MKVERKVIKARAKLVQHDPFFGSVALRLKPKKLDKNEIHTSRVKRIGTDSVYLIYNPKFIEETDLVEIIGAIAHEACHVAFKHPLRRGNRNFALWNTACDYAINSILINSGYKLPGNIRHDSQYDGMSAEKIYDALKQQEQEEDEGKYQLPDFEDDDYEPDMMPQIDDDFMGGVVLDAPEEAKTQDAEQKLDLEIEAAAIGAKIAGKLPGELERMIKAQHVHKINYRDLLRDWMEKNVFPSNYTWKKPNRRYADSELNLPAMDSDFDTPNIGVAVDASGSITDEELQIYSNEISGVLSEFECSFTVLYFDDHVRFRVDLSVEDMPIDLSVTAGGGTRFLPVFEYIRKHNIEMQALLFFTDMAAFDWDKLHQPGFPVLWMSTNPNYNKVPFGFIIPLEIKKED